MRVFFLFCCVANFIVGTLTSGCPFSKSYGNGVQRANAVSATKALLLSNNFLIDEGEPANDIWGVFPLPDYMISAYNKTNALLIAQQFFLEENASHRNFSNQFKLSYLQSITQTVPLADRCLPDPTCKKKRRYHETTGQCNNLNNPKWGSAYSPYGRLHPADYDDGIYTIRKSVTNEALPSPRLIGNILLQDSPFTLQPSPIINYGCLIFGQYITHDAGWRETYQNDSGGNGLRCCPKDYQRMLPDQLSYYGCYSTEVPQDDPYYSKFNMGCLSYIRSQPIFPNDCNLGSAQIANSVTSFLDHSIIYGSAEASAISVRSYKHGLLLIVNDVMALTPNCTGPFCYFTGDNRGGFYTTLGTWHSIFIRFHNNVATRLRVLNKHWKDERLFQESRRIITAVYHNIAYNEWLPYYIGADAYKRNVSCDPSSTYCGAYDPTVDPSNMNEFAHGAFRLFHANTPENVSFYDSDYNLIKAEPLSNHTNGVDVLVTNFNEILRGLVSDPAYFGKYPDNLRNTVFNVGNKDGIGMDLLSVDIARGRDHGLSPYHVYLNMSIPGGHIVDTWNDLKGIFSKESIVKLKSVYNSVLDIDLFVGLLLETKNGVYAGPVTTFIMEEQFYRFKYGDAFFYSFANSANPFTEDQIKEINSLRFANVLCQNSNVEKMLPKAFEIQSSTNNLVPCDSLQSFNLDLWKSKN